MKIEIGTKFKNENDIFIVFKKYDNKDNNPNLKNVWLSICERLGDIGGLWGFDESDIIENLIKEEKIEKAA